MLEKNTTIDQASQPTIYQSSMSHIFHTRMFLQKTTAPG